MMRLLAALALLVCCAAESPAQRDSTSAHAAYLEGRAALQERRADDAIKAFKKAIDLDSLSSDYHLWLGNAHTRDLIAASFIRKGMIARRILPEYNRAVALNPRSLDAADARLGFYLNAPAMVGGGMDKAKAEVARIRVLSVYHGGLAQGQLDDKAGDLAAAESDYRAVVRAFPDSSEPVLSLAAFFQEHARFADAFTVIDERLASFPNDTMVTYQLGRTAALSGKELDRGAAALKRFLSMLPASDRFSQASAHYRLGMIREKEGNPNTAREEYDQAIELIPRYDEAVTARKKLGR